jgi:hypothetical protein
LARRAARQFGLRTYSNAKSRFSSQEWANGIEDIGDFREGAVDREDLRNAID